MELDEFRKISKRLNFIYLLKDLHDPLDDEDEIPGIDKVDNVVEYVSEYGYDSEDVKKVRKKIRDKYTKKIIKQYINDPKIILEFLQGYK